ncbi:NAD(P)/FAD-dependent oxidoreductase [Streptomyces bobili]|uniref:phytoene desaturase family protein n=1 Tax=Streptomyces bobili TaxID=67280 RepID=UPI003441DB29
MSVDYDVIVIGAGIAGLSAAATLQRGGKRTLLLEGHNVPGGAATSFVRGRFEFEVSLHQLGGIGGPGPLRAVLDEMDAMRKLQFVEDDELYRTVVPGILDVTVPADWQGAVEVIDAHYPGNRTKLTRFLEIVREVGLWQLAARANLHKMKEQAEWLSGLPNVRRYGLRSYRQVLDEFFVDERVKFVLSSYWSYNGQLPSRMSFMDMSRLLTIFMETKPYQIIGGSQALSSAMLDSFLAAGGEARFNTSAEKILTRSGTVTGVRLDSGESVASKLVVSNAPSLSTYRRMLDPADVPASVLRDLRSRRLGPSVALLYLGLDAPAADLGLTSATNFLTADLDERSVARGMRSLEPTPFLLASCYDIKPTGFAPVGASQVVLASMQYAAPWEALSDEEYAEAKTTFADSQLNLLKAIAPGVRDVIEEAEVATPLTIKRYLSQPGGSIYGFDQDVTDSWLFREDDLKPSVPGLFLIGNWTTAGGYQSAIVTAARLCKRLLAT